MHCLQLAIASRGEQWLQAIFTEQEKEKLNWVYRSVELIFKKVATESKHILRLSRMKEYASH